MLVGLHKMAAERGDGLIPEMLDVLKRSGHAAPGAAPGFDPRADLVQFAERQAEAGAASRPASNENNVIAFPIARRGMIRR